MLSTSFKLAALCMAASQVSAVPVDPRQNTATTQYDYIIVGSGAAGIPLASRLSENGAKTLLIERGPPSSGRWGGTQKGSWLQGTNLTFYDVPALDNEIYSGSFSTGIYCDDYQTGIVAGCVLGGGTAINSGLWWRPAAIDWDWPFPAGWKSADMAAATNRVFKKIPGTHVPSMDGQLHLQQGAGLLEWSLSQAGWKQETSNDTPDQKTQTRVYTNTTYMFSNGERGGPMATYLVDAMSRPNFTLWTNTVVERVVRSGSKVTGLQIKSNGNGGHDGTVQISSTGSVVLSAGAIGTPKLLFRSGIGPQDQLKIVQAAEGGSMIAQNQWINLPVGENLIDNINTDIVITHPNVVNYDFIAAYDNPIAQDKAAYLNHRSGILAQSAANINPMVWEPMYGSDGQYRQLQWTARVSESLGITGTNGKAMTIANYLGFGQQARCKTTINSDLKMGIATMPNIHQNAGDREVIIKGLDAMRATLSNVSGIAILSPQPGVSSADYVDSTQHNPVNHWLGSCKMGTDDGRSGGSSVVDLNTKVYGTDNLFVVDASIFPGLTTSNPSAAIVIAAERASEKILALKK